MYDFMLPSGVSHIDAYRFFVENLAIQVESTRTTHGVPLRETELLYTASVLAHFAQVSCGSDQEIPLSRDLVDVFDRFVAPAYVEPRLTDPSILENGGSQILLLSGFFRKQVRKEGRHNIPWFIETGRSFYKRSSKHDVWNSKKRRLLAMMSQNFSFWSETLHNLSTRLRRERYLLDILPSSES